MKRLIFEGHITNLGKILLQVHPKIAEVSGELTIQGQKPYKFTAKLVGGQFQHASPLGGKLLTIQGAWGTDRVGGQIKYGNSIYPIDLGGAMVSKTVKYGAAGLALAGAAAVGAWLTMR